MLTTAKTKDIAINNSDPLVRELAIEALLAGIADDGKVELTQGIMVSPASHRAIMRFISCGMKIQAIKELRTETGLGLKAAKEALDVFLPPNNY